MSSVQRAVIVLGVLAALAVTFVWPPKIVHTLTGARLTVASCVTEYMDRAQGLKDCGTLATVDGGLLAVYLVVIAAATAALYFVLRGVDRPAA